MENKINIAELLRNCPSGMDLDCTMYDNLHFDKVDNYDKKIHCYIQYKDHRTHIMFGKDGTYNSEKASKCVIFPKGKTTWEGFIPSCQFKEGDIVTSKDKGLLVACIYKERKDNVSFNHHIALYKGSLGVLVHERIALTDDELRFATEEEKAKLFKAIKYKGYNWNEKTKTLEKFIKPKEDTNDKVVMAGIYFDREYYADEVELHLGNYEIKVRDGKTYAIFKNPDNKTLEMFPKFKVGDKIKPLGSDKHYIIKDIEFDRYVLNNNQFLKFINEHHFELVVKPKFKVGDRIKYIYLDRKATKVVKIRDKGYELDNGKFLEFQDENAYEISYDKFDINTLKPFDKVLVRDGNDETWVNAFFGFRDSVTYKTCTFITGNENWCQCIPYEGNEHLLGTTDDCDKYFKIWEN